MNNSRMRSKKTATNRLSENKMQQKIAPTIFIGKGGITESLIEETKKQLKKRQSLKVKMLGSFVKGKDKKELAKDLAEKTESSVDGMVGFVFILTKNRK